MSRICTHSDMSRINTHGRVDKCGRVASIYPPPLPSPAKYLKVKGVETKKP